MDFVARQGLDDELEALTEGDAERRRSRDEDLVDEVGVGLVAAAPAAPAVLASSTPSRKPRARSARG